MKKSCVYCGKIHPIGYVCPQSIKANQKGGTREDKFRSSTAWKKKREEIRSRDLCMCRICLSQGDYKRKNISVHHITPLAADYSKRLDNENLITLCDHHHELAERGELSADFLRSLADTPLPMSADFPERFSPTPGIHSRKSCKMKFLRGDRNGKTL